MEPIVDGSLVLKRRLRALRQHQEGADFLMRRLAEDLADRIGTVDRRFARTLAAFCTTADARDAMLASGRVTAVERLEADPALLGDDTGIVADTETVPLAAASRDLIVSLMSLHEANDIPGLLVQYRRALVPDGLFLAAFAGAGTLQELSESLLAAEIELFGGASPRVLPFTDIRDAGALLQRAGFALPVADVDTVTVRYQSMFGLMRDLRGMGATNALHARTRRFATPGFFRRAAEIYAERFADADGRVRATFNIIWLSGWSPHESQQKPLRPGSGRTSLADALRGGTE